MLSCSKSNNFCMFISCRKVAESFGLTSDSGMLAVLNTTKKQVRYIPIKG